MYKLELLLIFLCRFYCSGLSPPISFDPNDVRFYSYPDPSNVNFYKEIVYQNRMSLRNSGMVFGEPVTFLLHGFLANSTQVGQPCQVIGQTFLKENKLKNLICVDWGKLTAAGDTNDPLIYLNFALYEPAVENMKVVGKRVADFIQFLVRERYGPLKNYHLIGHSLGAHVCGIAGYHIRMALNELIGKITGLDPAAPLVTTPPGLRPPSEYLDRSDAAFVEVLHSNSDFFGTSDSDGVADWWANGGRGVDQPTCSTCAKLFFGTTAVSCGHQLAINYYAQTITRNYTGYPCSKSFDLPSTSLKCKRNSARGVNFGDNRVNGNYYLPIIFLANGNTPPTNDFATACSGGLNTPL